jgi:acyl dehydratase
MNETELTFVYEAALKAVPTFATVVAWDAAPRLASAGIDTRMTVHGEQSIQMHQPIPASGEVSADSWVTAVYDKGPKGAVIMTTTVLTDIASGKKIVTLGASLFARADGGFGGPAEGQPEPHSVPIRPSDLSMDFQTRPDQALLYRLLGDRNPLHADPTTARRAGFSRPILHGLCTYGLTCRAVLQGFADYRPDRIKSHAARFSAPVYPGETITIDMWRDDTVVSFVARVKDRNATVVTNGKTVLD